jgi:CDP-glucose 4,6-dehydratase
VDPPSEPNHWDLLKLPIADHRIDIRDEAAVRSVFAKEKPEIVFHLAAQPLVRRSYREPVTTWATNVMGTAHVLEAARHTPDVRAAVVVTTDKCYENREWHRAYRERDRLGGHDPYSASKAGAELVAASYRTAFLQEPSALLIATARGGNVIGGGDWSEDRLIPDLVRSVSAREPLVIRSPRATRPWQHVLDCLSGYLLLGQRLLAGDTSCADAWNFGPDGEANRTVEQVLEDLARTWPQLRWQTASSPQPHEAGLLQLDSAKANMNLGWHPVWNLEEAIHHTANWYRRLLESGEVSSAEELAAYVADAVNSGLGWATA